VKGDGDVADLSVLDSLVANGAVFNEWSDDVTKAHQDYRNLRERVDAVLSEGIVAADLTEPHLEVVVVPGV